MPNTDWTPEIAYALERYNAFLREVEEARLAAEAREAQLKLSRGWFLEDAVKSAFCAISPLQETSLCTVPNTLP